MDSVSRQLLLDALLEAETLTPGVRLLGVTPINFKGDGKTSITDAWRDSVYHVTLFSPWNYNSTLSSRQAQYNLASQSISLLRNLTPDAAYLVSRLSLFFSVKFTFIVFATE